MAIPGNQVIQPIQAWFPYPQVGAQMRPTANPTP
jgi:hypothetical protein